MKFKLESEGGKHKPAGYKIDYTPEQILELGRCMVDPVYFIETYCMLVHPTKGRMPIKLFEYQKRMIRAYASNSRVIAMAPRQMGKSQIAAVFLLWWCCFHDDQNVLVASNLGRGAAEIMERFRFMYEELPWFIKPGEVVYNKNSVRFDNNSFIEGVATTENTGRGLSLSYLYLDEFSKLRPSIQEAFYASTLPTLSTGGRLIITSTPNGDEDRFAKIWFQANDYDESYKWSDEAAAKIGFKAADDKYETFIESGAPSDVTSVVAPESYVAKPGEEIGFKRVFVHWKEHPDRDEEYKKKIFAEGFTEAQWKTEYECAFLSGDPTLIDPSKLFQLNATVRKPRLVDRFGGVWYHKIRPNTVHAITLDPSEGTDGDNAVIQVWSVPEMRQIAEWASSKADQIEQTRMLLRMMKRIHDTQQEDPAHSGDSEIYYSVECNGVGIGILNAIELEGEEKFPGYLIDSEDNKARGLRTTSKSKLEYCMMLKKMIERGLFVPASRPLVSELKNFIKRGRSYEAKSGTKDDRVMSCVLMLQMIDELKHQVDGIEEATHVSLAHNPEDDESDDEPMPAFIF